MASSYAPLHLHSNYSLLEGASTAEEYVAAAAGMGLPALALTDTNALYGAVPFYRAAKAAGVKPIIGARIEAGPHRAVLLAKNAKGYRNLCRIVTARRLEDGFDLAEALVRRAGGGEGLVVLSADPELLRRLSGGVEDLCAELPATLAKRRLREVFREARRLGLPMAATPAAYFVTPGRHLLHRLLTAVRRGELLENLPASAVAPEGAYLRTPGRMREFAGRVPGALSNTLEIARRCEFEFDFGTYHFPHTGVPEGETPFSHLSKLAFRGAERRYGALTPAVLNRLAHELDVIERLNFPEYFLIVEDIVRFARSEGISIMGRGSAADSLVAYCLGITVVDPLEYDLYFERFLNLNRTDCPDIDLDICWRRRDEVINYVYEKYGAGNVAMLSTHVTYRTRNAFRDVARAWGLPVEEVNFLSKRLPHYGSKDILAAARSAPEAAGFPIDEEPYRTIARVASKLAGYPRHLGVHLGALVIGDRPLCDYLPLEMATKGLVVTQYDMGPVEELGLVKMDLLGQRALTVVEEAAADVEAACGEKIDPWHLPPADPKTAARVRRGRTVGGFQVESPGMRNLLQMMRAGDRRDLLIGLSLIRPGPAASGMKEHYVRRRLGLEKPLYLHESMRESLSETYGVMLYQEDILKVARAVAGFDLAVGDELRKAISKGRSREAVEAMRNRFLEGAAERGVERRAALAVWEMISNFAAYSYCKAHATTYSIVSWATVYLKAHHPAQLLASRISNAAGFYHPRVYLEEARREGVRILPLDVNESAYEFSTGANSIRPGLMAVKHLSRRTAQMILDRRRERPFEGLGDFLRRVDAGKREAESLVLGGAFSSPGRTRPELLIELDAFFEGGAAALEEAAATELPEYPLEKILACEDEALEMTPTAHPMTPWREKAAERGALEARRMKSLRGRVATLAGFLVTRRRAPTKNGDMMEFATFEDETDIFEVTLFPEAYRRFGALLCSPGPFLIKGRVEDQYGAATLRAGRLGDLLERKPRRPARSFVTLPPEAEEPPRKTFDQPEYTPTT